MTKRLLIFRVLEALLIVFFLGELFEGTKHMMTEWYNNDMGEALDNTILQVDKSYREYQKEFRTKQVLFQAVSELTAEFVSDEKMEYTKEEVDQLKNLVGSDGIYISDREGKIIAGSDRLSQYFDAETIKNSLSVTEDHPVSEMVMFMDLLDAGTLNDLFEKNQQEPEWLEDMIVSGFISKNRILILREGSSDFMKMTYASGDIDEILRRNAYGPKGFYLYGSRFYLGNNPFDKEDVQTFDDLGLPEEARQEGDAAVYTVFGKKYLCKTKNLTDSFGADYLICFLPYSEVQSATMFIWIGEAAAVLSAFWLMHVSHYMTSGKKPRKKVSYRKKVMATSLFGGIMTIAVFIIIHILFLYSIQTRDSMFKARQVSEQVNHLDEMQADGRKTYSRYMERITSITARLLSNNASYREPEKLRDLADTIHAYAVLVYGPDGKVISSSRNYTGLELPQDHSRMASEFRWLLYGKEIVTQTEPDSDYLDEPCYFSGAPLIDQNGNYDGLVQIAVPVSFHDEMVQSVSLESVLSSFGGKSSMSVLALNPESGAIVTPDEDYSGCNATDLGITEEMHRDGYTGLVDVMQKQNILCCASAKQYDVIVLFNTLMVPLFGLIMGILLSLYGIIAEVLFAVLRIAELEGIKKDEKSILKAEKPHEILASYPYLVAGAVMAMTVFSRFFLRANDASYYIFVNRWGNGLHIYSFARCLMYICTAVFTFWAMSRILSVLYPMIPLRHETILRMFMSVLKYVVTIGSLIVCGGILGAPASSLLAVSGIVTLMFSMGAQSLVADILSGLFIIFEGTYKVGDMITIDQWHGKVVEIGIRNTKIYDIIENNVKVINNSTIKNIINYSEHPSMCDITISIDYEQDFSKVEKIFYEEKDRIKENLPNTVSEIIFKGIEEFADSSVVLKFSALCKNEDFMIVKRALNREIKAMFDRHGIVVPFPQIVMQSRTGEREYEESSEINPPKRDTEEK